ncbi:hypothetical protein [Halopseudomonas maritima]|uniref:hypothetical protein n=1 Tax=Halopseudomonas maritima TaxID=2918528 RepID=UPI001EEBC643|nr:hypothetical protein [Halopseudomonas maritima]UJJ30436.1 hypothetical protein HV822_11640 [Halopseudomonas maritima]
MDRKSRFAALLVVLCTALFLLGYLWANQQRLQVPGYGFLRSHDGLLSVRFDRQLLWLDAAGSVQQQLDLSRAGLVPTGDHAFFANGDLLVYHRPKEAGVGYWLARYLRLQKQQPRPQREQEGFYRCELAQLACAPYGRALPALDSAFRLAVAADDTVFVADTPGFVIYRLAAGAATPERTADGLLRFPNQLRLSDEGLWVADTNNQRLLLLGVEAPFGAVLREVVLSPQQGRSWPHQFAVRGSEWLVNMADDSMRDGLLVRFSTTGAAIGVLAADALVDPLAIEPLADQLWVVDAEAGRLLRLDQEGALMPQPVSGVLAELEQQAAYSREGYLWAGRVSLAGMVLSLLAGFLAAWLLEREQTRAQFAGWSGRGLAALVAAEPTPIPGGGVYWLTNRLQRRVRWLMPAMALVAIALVYVLIQVLLLGGAWQVQLQMLALTLYAMLALGLVTRDFLAAARQRLGVSDEALLLEVQGRLSRVPLSQIRYSRSHLLAPDQVLFVGQQGHTVFDRKELEQLLFPRLRLASPCAPWVVWKALWHTRHSQAVVLAVLLPVTVGLMLSLRLLD